MVKLKRETYWGASVTETLIIIYVVIGMVMSFASGYAVSRGQIIEAEITECRDRR